MASDTLYRQILVWKRWLDAETKAHACVYVCVRRIFDNKVCVQNVEFFHVDGSNCDWNRVMKNTGELFLDDDIDNRGGWHDSIADAVKAHDEAFGNPA